MCNQITIYVYINKSGDLVLSVLYAILHNMQQNKMIDMNDELACGMSVIYIACICICTFIKTKGCVSIFRFVLCIYIEIV